MGTTPLRTLPWPAASATPYHHLDMQALAEAVDSLGLVVCTSSTKPGTPTVGLSIYETDTKARRFWDGTEWVTVYEEDLGWDPTLQTTGSAPSTSLALGQWVRVGNIVHCVVDFTLSGTGTGDFLVDLPIDDGKTDTTNLSITGGICKARDSATRTYLGSVEIIGSSGSRQVKFVGHDLADDTWDAASIPMAWASGDTLSAAFSYFIA